MLIKLKGGHYTHDKRLARIPEFDERSRKFNIRNEFVPAVHTAPRSYSWASRVWLDQSSDPKEDQGGCVGFSWAQLLGSRPHVVDGIDNRYGYDLYHLAQTLDEFPGTNYSGSSTLGGAKAAQAKGHIGGYSWAFSTLDLAIGVSWLRPAVVGINWYDDMFTPDTDGLIKVKGKFAGGHDIEVNAFNVERQQFKFHNSWGNGWGVNGECWISFDDLDRLLNEAGDACLPTVKIK